MCIRDSFGGKWKINDKDSINTSFPIFLKILKKSKYQNLKDLVDDLEKRISQLEKD